MRQQLEQQLAHLMVERRATKARLKQLARDIAKVEGALELLDVQAQQAKASQSDPPPAPPVSGEGQE